MSKKYIGKTCPYCKTPLVEGDTVVFCSVCDMPHHLSCWQDNQGCTTFGCTGSIKEIIGNDSGAAVTPAAPQPTPAPVVAPKPVQAVPAKQVPAPAQVEQTEKPIETLYESKEMVFMSDVPIVLENTAIIIDRTKDKLFARCTFRSITDKAIKAVLIEVSCQDVWGSALGEPIAFQYLDLKTKRESKFGQTNPIELTDKTTRKISVLVKKILFADGSIITGGDRVLTMAAPVLLSQHLKSKELAAEYARETTNKAQFVPESLDSHWRCTCGSLNVGCDDVCHHCGSSKESLITALNPEVLNTNMLAFQAKKRAAEEKARAEQAERIRLAEEQVRLERERKEQEILEAERVKREKKRRTRKMIIATISAILAALLVCGVIFFWAIPYFRYQSACKALENREYDVAYQMFVDLDDFMDSDTMVLESLYQKAKYALTNNLLDEAISIFTELGNYSDSETQLADAKSRKENAEKEALYQEGVVALNNGQYDQAITIFAKLDDYADSKTKLTEAQTKKEAHDKEVRYQEGITALENKQYAAAITIFTELGNYSDSKAKLAEAQSKNNTVTVYTAQELVDSINHNKKIILGANYYDLTNVSLKNSSFLKRQSYSDKGIVIQNVNNLSIEGNAKIVIGDIYAEVLSFERCSNLSLTGITVGHTNPSDTNMCEGAVVRLESCTGVQINSCKLFGCGAIGIDSYKTTGITVTSTDIYDCTYVGVSLVDSTATFSICKFYDLPFTYSAMILDGTTVEFSNCSFEGINTTTNDWGECCLLDGYTITSATFENCTFSNNKFANIAAENVKNVVFKECIFFGNDGQMSHNGVLYQDCRFN